MTVETAACAVNLLLRKPHRRPDRPAGVRPLVARPPARPPARRRAATAGPSPPITVYAQRLNWLQTLGGRGYSDGRTDGRTDELAKGGADGQADERTDGRNRIPRSDYLNCAASLASQVVALDGTRFSWSMKCRYGLRPSPPLLLLCIHDGNIGCCCCCCHCRRQMSASITLCQ